MADHPVIRIQIDAEDFDKFADRWNLYRTQVADQPEAWKETNAEVKVLKSRFEDTAAAFAKLEKSAQNPRFERSVTKFGTQGKAAEKDWRAIGKHVEKTHRDMSGLARMTIGLSAFGKGFGAVTAVGAAALGATKKAADDFSNQNKQNREIGLKPGEATAFKDQYGPPLGANAGDLANISAIKQNRGRWSEIYTATAGGVSANDIETKPVVELYLEALQKAAEAKKRFGGNGGLWADSSGANALFGTGTLNNAATRDDAWFQQTYGQYAEERDKVAQRQPDLDQSTAFVQKWNDDMSQVKTGFEKALMPLEPKFIDAAKGIANFIDELNKSGEIGKDIDLAITAFKKFEKAGDEAGAWIDAKLKLAGITVDKNGVTVEAGSPAAETLAYGRTFADEWKKDHSFIYADGIDAKSATLMGGILGDHTGDAANARNKALLGEFLPWASNASSRAGAWVKDYMTGGGTFGMPGYKPSPPAPGEHWDWPYQGSGGTSPASGQSKKNNPGNLRPANGKGFASFDSVDAGVSAMDRQLEIYAGRDHLNTLNGIISKYAPPSENNTGAYIRDVSARTGFKADDKLNMSDPRVRAALESAMIQHESHDFRDLTTEKVLSAITQRFEAKTGGEPENGNGAARSTFKMPNQGPQAPNILQLSVNVPPGANVNVLTNMAVG
ncbi:hypothetical protein SBC1_31420 [Caballeronia sp. SBC1]|uniref:hypothetical protein n=1 Tax=Caballeronia sp. SBC1 TaxID=2705548 RepID=UPI00140E17DE|nr:hypothetical protein [Caballeronia sp. SBC1]QIN63118.1 hypothetical protein SBC1_31420 [Caballeronia sp. SBC1]